MENKLFIYREKEEDSDSLGHLDTIISLCMLGFTLIIILVTIRLIFL